MGEQAPDSEPTEESLTHEAESADEADVVDGPGSSESEASDNTEAVETDAPADESGDPATAPGADQGGAAEGDTAEITSAPDSIEVTGKLRVFPSEPTHESLERRANGKTKKQSKKETPKEIPIEEQRFELSPEDMPEESVVSEPDEGDEHLDLAPAMVLLETAEGDTLPLDPGVVDDDAVSGSTFTGTVAMEAAAQESVEEAVSASPEQALTESEVVDVAAEAMTAADETFTVLDSEITPLPEPASTSGSVMHSADVVFFTDSTTSQVAAVQELMTITSNYWKRESAGLVAGIKVNAVKQERVGSLDVCNEISAWDRARELFQDPGSYYGKAKHLVVLVDQSCPGEAVGWGSVSNLHDGGQTWVNLGYRRAGDPLKYAVQTLQHEIGHNLGLGHSGVRSCYPAGVSDTALAYVDLDPGAVRKSWALCADEEYGDMWGVMGYANAPVVRDSNSPALPIAQKIALGVPAAGMVAEAKPSAGLAQRFTLQALSSNAGTRGLRVQQSAGSEPFFVEYRNGMGSDSAVNSVDSEDKGVRIHKTRGSQSIEIHTPAVRALQAGQSLHPFGGRARVTVESMTSAQAVVRVDFYTSFTDVKTSDRFSGSIQWMYDQKISTGSLQPDKSVMYGPLVDVSREAVAAFFFREYAPAGYVPGAKGRLPFTDITTTHRFYKEIYWMWERGVTTGTLQADGTRKYLPGDPLTREAMSAFLYRAEGASYAPPSRSPFVDVATTNMFYKYIAWMYAKGVSTGTVTSAGREYRPKTNTTRETMAPFMQRASQI